MRLRGGGNGWVGMRFCEGELRLPIKHRNDVPQD